VDCWKSEQAGLRLLCPRRTGGERENEGDDAENFAHEMASVRMKTALAGPRQYGLARLHLDQVLFMSK
jgi:hypothetical protein